MIQFLMVPVIHSTGKRQVGGMMDVSGLHAATQTLRKNTVIPAAHPTWTQSLCSINIKAIPRATRRMRKHVRAYQAHFTYTPAQS
jgi:hypothetical protein